MTSKDKFFSNKLLEWYEKNQRELPWRKNIRHKDYPYRVLVSEFMLQQTTVATVVPYFKKFINEWPTLKKLSHAKIEDVLLFWQGLGYYSRAKNLLKTVKIIDEDYNGKIPKDKINLIKLPGIGEYASAAISSIAFNKKAVAIDGNVKRVIARYYEIRGNNKSFEKKISEIAERICPNSKNRSYTQAVMELGAIICKPKNSDCHNCCLKSKCSAHKKNTVDLIPTIKSKPLKQKLNCISFLTIHNNSKILLKKRTGKKILANQWEIPSTNWKVKPVKFSKKSTPIPNAKWKKTNVEFKHSFSHIDLKNTVYKSNINNSQIQFNEDDLKWVDLKKLNKYAVTTMSKKALNLLNLIQI